MDILCQVVWLRYLSVDPLGAVFRLLHAAIKVDGQHVLGTRLLPRVPMPQPIVCLLHLRGKEEKLVTMRKESR